MSGGIRPVPEDDFARLVGDIDRIKWDVQQLQMPTGTQIFEAKAKLEQALDDIGTYVDAYLASGFTTGSMHATGNVTVDGMTTSTGGLNSVDVFNRLVTGSGAFRTVSVNVLGAIGQTVSSMKYKQDITPAVIPRETLRALRLVFFRYIARAPFDQEQQPWLLGLIAEEVHALGLTWLVVYDDNGEPEALVDFALPFLGLLLAQYNADDIDELRSENDELRARLDALDGGA